MAKSKPKRGVISTPAPDPNEPMYTVCYINKDGRVFDDARVGVPRFDNAVAVAKSQFFGRVGPRSNAVGFYILDNAGREVWRWSADDDAPPPPEAA
jgi:hypothetical protein